MAHSATLRTGRRSQRAAAGWVTVQVVTLLLLVAPTYERAIAQTSNQPTSAESRDVARAKIETNYEAAKAAVAATNSIENLWKLGRAAFDRADSIRDKTKAQVAEAGIAACRAAIQQNSGSTPSHYYLALCLGQLAQTKSLAGLRLVREMVEEFEKVRTLDEFYDHAGADRGLGLLYLEAPGWPTSIGDRKKARAHLEHAVALAPNYPENRLVLIDLLIRTKDNRSAIKELSALESIWPAAQVELNGEAWAQSWSDWTNHKKSLAAKLPKPNAKTGASSR